nr:unnamed protein product [Naegleria fowleri]
MTLSPPHMHLSTSGNGHCPQSSFCYYPSHHQQQYPTMFEHNNTHMTMMTMMDVTHSPSSTPLNCSPIHNSTSTAHSLPMLQQISLNDISIGAPTFLKLDIQDIMQAWRELYGEEDDDEQRLPSEISNYGFNNMMTDQAHQ